MSEKLSRLLSISSVAMPNANSADWNGGVSQLSRVNVETNTCISQPAYGRLNGQATLTALLDGQPISVTTNTSGNSAHPLQWRSEMELTPGAHQLKVAALHPPGFYTAWATNSSTNNLAGQTAAIGRDGDGNIEEPVTEFTNLRGIEIVSWAMAILWARENGHGVDSTVSEQPWRPKSLNLLNGGLVVPARPGKFEAIHDFIHSSRSDAQRLHLTIS